MFQGFIANTTVTFVTFLMNLRLQEFIAFYWNWMTIYFNWNKNIIILNSKNNWTFDNWTLDNWALSKLTLGNWTWASWTLKLGLRIIELWRIELVQFDQGSNIRNANVWDPILAPCKFALWKHMIRKGVKTEWSTQISTFVLTFELHSSKVQTYRVLKWSLRHLHFGYSTLGQIVQVQFSKVLLS